MSYFWYMAITVSAVIFQLVFLPLLGKFSDKFGNIKLMRTSSMLIGAIPFLWIASALIENDLMVKIYLLIVPSIVSGFAWAGYNLALNNYVYDAIGNRKSGFGLSYMNLLIGIGGFAGAGIGALIAWMDVSLTHPLFLIFAVSGIGRFVVAIYGSSSLHEVRNVKRFSSQFWIREFTPVQGILREVHDLEHLVEKVEHYIIPGEKVEFMNGKRVSKSK
jgi:MFS family permease